jgi:hypothetical protein
MIRNIVRLVRREGHIHSMYLEGVLMDEPDELDTLVQEPIDALGLPSAGERWSFGYAGSVSHLYGVDDTLQLRNLTAGWSGEL